MAPNTIADLVKASKIKFAEKKIALLALDMLSKIGDNTVSPKEANAYFTLLDIYLEDNFSKLKLHGEAQDLILEGMMLHDLGKYYGADVELMKSLAKKIIAGGKSKRQPVWKKVGSGWEKRGIPELVTIGKIDKKVFIKYSNMEKKVIFSFKFGDCYVHTKADLQTCREFIINCKRQKQEQGKTRAKVLAGISPDKISYIDNLELKKRYAKTAEERSLVNALEKVLGKRKLPSKDLVSDKVLMSIGDFNIALDKKKYFKVRDCIISSEEKLNKIVHEK
ncbi:MAG: hypothetical protein PHI59_09035 [Candidatus Omnitrophica bacterium]|nr:hypothetical protein [Candidatus Omnitrophota bacterium]